MCKWLFALLCISISFAECQTVKFTIFSFNDVYEVSPNKDGVGGIAEITTLLEQERAKAERHVTTMNGDFLSPSLLSVFDKGKHIIELFNAMNIDLLSIGNHEFDFGPEILQERLADSSSACLAANVYKSDGTYFAGDRQTVIYDVDGIKIGFFGLLTIETPVLSSPGKDVHFAPLSFTAKKMVQELKSQGADVIVALTHLLIEEDRQLAKEVPEIDIILGGHDHEPITWYEGKCFIHKSGCNAQYLARIDLVIDAKMGVNRKKVKVFPSWRIILNKGVDPHPQVAAQIAQYKTVFESIAKEPIVKVSKRIDSTYSVVRTQESTMGNLVADAVRSSCNADASIISSGIIRGNRVYKPDSAITMKDLMEELPFANFNMLLELSGKDIIAALENGVSQFEGKAGRFPQVAGMQFSFDLNQPPGERVSEVNINGKKVLPYNLYRIATVDYMWTGGDGYNSLKNGKVLIGVENGIQTLGSVHEYFKAQPDLSPELEDRIICIRCRDQLDDNMLTVQRD